MARALLILLSAVLCSCFGAEFGWQPSKEYSFSIQGQNLAGLPQLKQQYAGFHFHGELRVQSHSSTVLLLKLLNMNYTKIHEEFSGSWWNGPDSSTKKKTKTLPITALTVVVILSKNSSPKLEIQSGLEDWQVNFIKGVVSKLLIQFRDNSQSGSIFNKLSHSQESDVYSVMEDSVVGRCEMLYEINSLPNQLGPLNSRLCGSQPLLEITKTRNYSNCDLLNEDHARLPTADCTPGGANCGHFWTRADLTQMIGCGQKNRFTLLSSVSRSVVSAQLHLHNNSQAVINSNINITLVSVSNLKQKFNPAHSKLAVKDLLYSYSTTPKENGKNSEEELPTDPESKLKVSGQMDPTNDNDSDIEDSGKAVKKLSGSRSKRGLKKKNVNKYKKQSNPNENNDNSDDRDYYSSNEHSNTQESSNPKGTNGKHSSEQMYPEGIDSESSDELGLEEQWKISGKEGKSTPPHQPFNIFTLAHRTSYDLSCLNPKLQQIIAEIASDLEEINILPEKQTMAKLSLAVDICRSLPLDRLSSVGEEIFEVHNGTPNVMKNNERKVFRDVITMCGTHPALHLIKGWVEREQVEGEEAAEMIASLPTHIFSPTNYLMSDFFEMVREISEKEDKQLTTTAVLALSNLVRDACVNQVSRKHHFSSIVRPVCGQRLVQHVTQWLRLQVDSDHQLSRVYIGALGNIGSTEVISKLRDIVFNPRCSSYLQTSAVFAMRYLVLQKSPEVAPLLISMYHNYSLPVGTRLAAVSLLVYSNPGLTVWQRLAISTWYEPNPAVAQFVSSTIRTMATTRDSLYSHLRRSASLVQPLARPSRINIHQPYNLLSSWLSQDLEKLVLEQLSWMQFSDYTSLYYRHSSRYSGFSRTNMEASVAASNPDGLWSALKELFMTTNDVHGTHLPVSGISRTLADIQKSLDLQPRSLPHMQAELHLKINNMMERMMVIDEEKLKSWAKGGQKLVSQTLKEGKSLAYQKADMNCLHISTTTELGFPVVFSVRTPWILNAKTNLNITDKGLVIGASFMYASQLLSSMSVMSPWDNTAHSAGAYSTNFLQLPQFRLVLNLENSPETVQASVDYIDQHRLLYVSMQPFTSQPKVKIHQVTLLSPDTIRIKLGEPKQMPISWLSHNINSVYSTEQIEHFKVMDFLRQARSIAGFPMVMPNMEARSFESVMNQLHPINMNFTMSMATKSMGMLEIESPRDTIVGKLMKYLITSENTQPDKPINSKITNLAITEQSQKSPKDNGEGAFATPEGLTKREPSSSEKKNRRSSAEDQDIMKGKYPGSYKVYATTYDSATGNFNASQVDPFTNTVNGSSHSYLIEQVLDQINSGKAIVFGFNMWSAHPDQPTEVSAYAAYSTTHSSRASRLGLFMKNEYSQVRVTGAHEDPVDIATDLRRQVAEDLHHNLFADYLYLLGGRDVQASMKASFGVSRRRLGQLRNSPLLEACSQKGSQHFDSSIDRKCQELRAQAKGIGFGNITVFYNDNAKFIEQFVQMYLNTARVMLSQTEEKPGENFNRLAVILDMNHRTEAVTTYITTPASSIIIYRYPLSKLPLPTLTEWLMQGSASKEFCGISSHRVKTFDGAELQYKMKGSQHLVAKDCSKKYGFAVLAQPGHNNTMMIEVNVDDQFMISMEEGPKVYVNGKLQSMSTSQALLLIYDRGGNVVAHTVFTPDNSIHLNLPGNKLDLVYSGTSLILRGEQGLQGRLCGLCGTYSNTGVEWMLTAQGSPAKSPVDFYSSYIFKDTASTMETNN